MYTVPANKSILDQSVRYVSSDAREVTLKLILFSALIKKRTNKLLNLGRPQDQKRLHHQQEKSDWSG